MDKAEPKVETAAADGPTVLTDEEIGAVAGGLTLTSLLNGTTLSVFGAVGSYITDLTPFAKLEP